MRTVFYPPLPVKRVPTTFREWHLPDAMIVSSCIEA
jgi:hypothetical protein